ncbi:arylamine N-acetyltransferase family protein [Billgrantia desiderata]|uniref:Acetyltransferase n=1 Tax=Billgrantia desiderata TaxID=52021 RepID=A0AAW4YPR9_9GAMM|nr:arylamine N-acetyltransferase [Halomonas desiderata]MCE8011525.1 acetyltransferase [Halomonas desiderata]MCE8050389.1 acetyltransferase [Halomonas desiderata]NIC36560.1 arylamine N-acetyltransferase [Halomonas desiderata]SEG08608.1 N-hydroxyarylamine O-acetyltransferase [Halomonas desiderata]
MQAVRNAQPLHESTQWETSALDLDAYLARIDYRGPLAPSLETLTALQQAHLAAVPFENLEIVTGGEIRIDLESLQDKLVRRRRGGYCHEQNTLFATVLDRLGFEVAGRNARMLMGEDASVVTPLGHTLLVVKVAGHDWMVDVGVGNVGPREPIRLEADLEVSHGPWEYRLERSPLGYWLLRHKRLGEWFNIYQFSDEPCYRADSGEYNYLASRHPGSPFVRRIVAQHNGAEIRLALTDLELKIFRPGQAPELQRIEADALPDVLRQRFGLALTPEQERALLQRAETLVETTSEGEQLGT